ncbi:Protein CBR-CPR-6 [Caenorhabditis briggsae]|uniref:Protein CBR-CPR-6 n=1 Tax=Caenorhabditis briggsae TaxID=6238 RepID=A8XC48_CAEBR|nr:Protein CBR-CPR-6 [Caenorhabditis briggsae]CAP30146.2 Protein CBR-CPR-6 [Caenorhabditis briggsae]
MKTLLLLCCLAATVYCACNDNVESVLDKYRNREIDSDAAELEGDELIDYINDNQNLWTAKKQKRFTSVYGETDDKAKWGLMGVNHVRLSVKGKQHLSKTKDLDLDIPESFDSRENWPKCQSIRNIRDQSSCGSCWAFGAVEAMSDRICIASHGELQVSLSADDLLSCCRSCGFGCNGGDPLAAWRYWVKDGIVTGSNYTANSGCKFPILTFQPYPFPPCEHHSKKTHFDPCPHDLYPTPKCEKKCIADYTDKTYSEDKFYGHSAYGVKDDVEAIQKELMTHGPLEIAFEVYEDFLNYDGGVYVHTGGKLGGGHAVKLIGWGIEDGIPYWTCANSWNTDWGEDGFFRILRGVDECGIESGVVGGIPKLNSVSSRLSRHHRRHAHYHEVDN